MARSFPPSVDWLARQFFSNFDEVRYHLHANVSHILRIVVSFSCYRNTHGLLVFLRMSYQVGYSWIASFNFYLALALLTPNVSKILLMAKCVEILARFSDFPVLRTMKWSVDITLWQVDPHSRHALLFGAVNQYRVNHRTNIINLRIAVCCYFLGIQLSPSSPSGLYRTSTDCHTQNRGSLKRTQQTYSGDLEFRGFPCLMFEASLNTLISASDRTYPEVCSLSTYNITPLTD